MFSNSTPQSSVLIELTKGYQTAVDQIDSDLSLVPWCACSIKNSNRVYASRKDKKSRKSVFLHREIMSRILGRVLLRQERVDHCDNDPLNNCRGNLRLATHAQNMANRKKNRVSKQPYKGIEKVNRRWRARIKVNGQKISLGYFDTPEEAHAVYCEAAIKYFGSFARFW